MTIQTVDVLGIPVAAVTGDEILVQCDSAIAENSRRVFAYANAHGLNIAGHDPAFARFLKSADLVYPDGQGVRLAARLLGGQLPHPTALTRWIWDLARHCERKTYRLFLLGGTPSAAATAASRLQEQHPRLSIEHYHGYFSAEETPDVLKRINEFHPQVLLVGFGMPMQEFWIDRNRTALTVNVIFPAGSAIDFAAGVRRPSPVWISRIGVEWLFRLFQEPRRLFRRYTAGNVQFVLAVLAQRFNAGNHHQ